MPTVFLYDNYPGGVGLSGGLYELRWEVIDRALELVGACGCARGCPACVGPILGSDERSDYSPKIAALQVLALMSARARTDRAHEPEGAYEASALRS